MLTKKVARARRWIETWTLAGLLPASVLLTTVSCGKQEPAHDKKTATAKKPKDAKAKKGEKNDKQAAANKKLGGWPDGSQLVISISMQFEAGGQPEGAQSPFSASPLPKGTPDLPANSWFRYGAVEGLERMLNLWDKHDIKVTSHMVGEAALAYPEVAKDIAKRGHEVAAHGMSWKNQWDMSEKDELAFIKDGADALEKVTGQRPVGYNANWLRRSKNTLKTLQELGFTYHIDDVSRDEPFLTTVKGKPFVVVPYTLRNNDIVLVEGRNFSADRFLAQLKLEFDQLYSEGAKKRRMMSVSLHDRIGGTPAMVRAMDQFITYVKEKDKVSFKRKDEIAKIAASDPKTPKDDSEATYNAE